MEMAVCYVRESFRSRGVELSSGIRRERTQWLYVCSKGCNYQWCQRTSRSCTCVRILDELWTVIKSCVLNSECNKLPL
jgi:hypothetical protein